MQARQQAAQDRGLQWRANVRSRAPLGVLMTRWRDLRAQLHGDVIAPGEVNDEPAHREIADGLNRKAPTFAPYPSCLDAHFDPKTPSNAPISRSPHPRGSAAKVRSSSR
jgi:hypothetical protein